MKAVVDNYGFKVQVFTLTKGQIEVTSGTFDNITIIYCVEDGVLMLNSFGETVSMVAGEVFGIPKQSVTVVSGKWHLS